jgi:sterol desaturase/sphingolipid hydroxylase (fatty acid hydroxylase superfamily)
LESHFDTGERLLEYLAARVAAWAEMVSTPKMIAVIAFLGLILLADIASRGWRPSWSRRVVAGVLTTLSIFHINFLLVPVVWLASEQVKALYALAGIPSIAPQTWAAMPLWIVVPIAVVAYDFANYCAHRVLHTGWLWPIHAIHHSDPDVNGLTGYRIHLFEGLVMWVSYTLLLTWLGFPADAIGIGAVIIALYNVYVHINVDWHHGPLRLVLASPRFHRWHHADVKEASGKNLAGIFPIFDWLFGTYYVPGKCEERMGAHGVPENDVVQLVLYPLQEWWRMGGSRLQGAFGRLTVRKSALPPAVSSTNAEA